MPAERIKTYVQERSRRSQEARDDYETSPDRPLDDLKTDVTEILGEHGGTLRNPYRRQADRLEAQVEAAEDSVDVKSRRERYLEYRNNATLNKMNRINGKIANSSNGFFSKQINRQRRQTVDNLNYKMGVRANSIKRFETQRKQKPEELRKEIDKLVDQRLKALERKAQRIVMHREKGIKPGQFAKKAEFLATITPEMKAKVVHEAILQVRKRNIESGTLDSSYEVDNTLDKRKIGGHYGRTIE